MLHLPVVWLLPTRLTAGRPDGVVDAKPGVSVCVEIKCCCVSAFFCGCVSPCDTVQVMAETAAAAQNVGTLGVALTTCTLPGQRPSSRLDADTIEVCTMYDMKLSREKT